ncbi:MAG: 16S rRNA (adenine(1518)-N(6)/adenine(1519)-N(6))-dimethyltransferase RsmA [Anaeroplasmataceae bacterium]
MENKKTNKEYVIETLNNNEFKIKKKFGQNFLLDQNIINNILDSADIDEDTYVIEIGPGMGALTKHIVKRCKQLLCYEIDTDLKPILEESFKDVNNVKFLFQDILKSNVEEDIKDVLNTNEKVVLISNLPYYITTPIITSLLETTDMIRRYVLMMQEEVADRICSKPNIKDYNALSVFIQYKCFAFKEFHVGRNVFIPAPNVDSAVIRLEVKEQNEFVLKDEPFFYKLIRGCFAQRRKTLYNNLSNMGFEKCKITASIEKLGLPPLVRSEVLTVKQFVDLSNELN